MSELTLKNKNIPMTPKEIVGELDRYIIGQIEAKRKVAIALRNRWRRSQVPSAEMRAEIMPKNILMIGPTGVGKTEIARRLARLVNAPFIKVEATKFTEVGYVGRDVESIIRDLVDVGIKMVREQEMAKVRNQAKDAAEERVLDALLPAARKGLDEDPKQEEISAETKKSASSTRQKFRKKLREGDLDDKLIEIDISASAIGVEIMAPPGMEEMTSQLQNMLQSIGSDRTKRRKLKVKDALKQITDEEAAKLISDDDIKTFSIENVEQNGIVFIDEIDKVTRRSNVTGIDVSREGVQRDLLPLVEGTTVSTKYGPVKTDHILFIASGAFHLSKPTDLVPELQGRLPIRVELLALTIEDFVRILTEPDASLTKQYIALLKAEEFAVEFKQDAIQRIAEIAWQVNERTENIGARRLHTVLERLLEEISFEATECTDKEKIIDREYVDKQMSELLKDEDLSRYIL